jgi:membrane complex biogenesis BtpA family protein
MWTIDLFGVEKPVIALLHLDPLPGDPYFGGDMIEVLRHARADLLALQTAGVDGILIANEFSLPYQPVPDIAVISAMAYLVGKLRDELILPFGVNVVKNPIATIDLAAATGAQFIRSAFSGAYMGEYGIYISNSGEAVRRRKTLGIEHVKMLYKVNPEADTYLVQRDIKMVTQSILNGCFPDGLCVSGSAAGAEPDDVLLEQVYNIARPKGIPVFCNTGCHHENVRQKLARCDGVCIGTAFKESETMQSRVDERKAKAFMALVKAIRQSKGPID